MRRLVTFLALVFAVLFPAPGALAQTKTIVSATVVDPNGVPYAGGSVATQLVPSTGTPTINKVPVNVQNNPAAIDANGHFTVSLWCNTAGGACTPLDQSGTQWQFTITNPGAQPPVGFGGVSFTVSVTITGTTQDLSSTLSAASVPLYRDSSSSGGICPSGAVGNLQYTNGTNCASTAEMNYNAGSDTLSLTPANQTFTATAMAQTGTSTFTQTVGSASPVTPGSVTQRSVTGTTDTILSTDRQNRVVYNSASAVAVSLPANGTSGFSGGFNIRLSNQNAGTVTVTPAAGLINGNATLVLLEGQDCFITPSSPPGTNYAADCNEPQMTAGANVLLTRSVHGLQISLTGLSPAPQTLAATTNLFVNSYVQSTGILGTAEVTGNDIAGAASASAFSLTGTVFTGGNGSTTFPLLYLNQTGAGTAPTTLNVNGTELGINAPIGFTGNLADFFTNGTEEFSISSGGSPSMNGGAVLTWIGLSKVRSPANGRLRVNNNADGSNGMTRFTFGTEAASNPALCMLVGILQSCDGTGSVTLGNNVDVSLTGNKVFVTSNFTTAANTSLQAITGLTFNFPATAQNWEYECDLTYSQATGNAAVAFGIQAATNNPTNIFGTGAMQLSTTAGVSTYASGTLATLATTTPTNILSGTPLATATNYTVHLAGTLELGASANAVSIMVSTATSADAVTVLRGSGCRLI